MSTLSIEAIRRGIARIREDLAAAEAKYAGRFVDSSDGLRSGMIELKSSKS